MNWILFGKIILWPIVLFLSSIWVVFFFCWLRPKQTAEYKTGGLIVLFSLGMIDLILIALLITIYNPAQ